MPRKKTSKEIKPRRTLDDSVEILSAGEIVESTITDTLKLRQKSFRKVH